MNISEGTQPGDAFIAATIPSGGGGDEPEIPVIHVTSISLNKSSLRLQAGANATLAVSISPVNADNKQVIWNSSDTGIATVENGVVTGVRPGVVEITAQSVDGGHTAVCEVTIAEAVIPEIDLNGLDTVLTFLKAEEATSYEVRVHGNEDSDHERIATYVIDAEGNIITELGTVSLRGFPEKVLVPLKGLDIDGVYTIEVQVSSGLDIVDIYTVGRISNPVSNEYLPASGSWVIYQNGTLSLEHLDGHHFYLMTMEGEILGTSIT